MWPWNYEVVWTIEEGHTSKCSFNTLKKNPNGLQLTLLSAYHKRESNFKKKPYTKETVLFILVRVIKHLCEFGINTSFGIGMCQGALRLGWGWVMWMAGSKLKGRSLHLIDELSVEIICKGVYLKVWVWWSGILKDVRYSLQVNRFEFWAHTNSDDWMSWLVFFLFSPVLVQEKRSEFWREEGPHDGDFFWNSK